MTDCMKTFIDMCNHNKTPSDEPSSALNYNIDIMTLEQLNNLMEQHKSHLRFMKEMGKITDEETAVTVLILEKSMKQLRRRRELVVITILIM